MGTKPVTRDDGKTVTGHVWVKGETERANEEPGDAFARGIVRNMTTKLDDEIMNGGISKAVAQAYGFEPPTIIKTEQPNPQRPLWPATPLELETFARMFFDRCLDIMRAKNARYAGEEDPFRNLRRGGVFGIAVRMDDKVSRMLTLSHPLNKLDGLDESIEDTAVDMANYAMLMLALKTNLGGK